jgi:hypothetical protein
MGSQEGMSTEPRPEAGEKPAPAPAAAPRGLKYWLERLTSWAHANRDELVIVGSLLVLCVVIKLLWLTPVDVYWDAGAKWHFVRQWSYANDFSQATWSHHMARFGVNVPVYFAQLLFGTDVRVYYVVPIALFTLQVLFVYLLGRRVGGRVTGILAALGMIFFRSMTRNASQLLPDGMVGTAAIIGGYCLVRLHEASGPARWRWLVGVSVSCIWAYAIKESSVLLFPGFMLAIWLSKRSFKEALLFGAILGAYGLFETAGFRLFTPYAHRLAIVNEEHGFYPEITFWGLLGRFTALEPPWKLLLGLAVVSAVFDVRSSDRRRRLLLIVSFGYLFFLTFLVRSIDPLMQWMSFKTRYMSPAAPFFFVSIAWAVKDLTLSVWARVSIKWPIVRAIPQYLANQPAASALGLCWVLGAFSYGQQRPFLRYHPLRFLGQDAAILNDAYSRNLPIVEDAKLPKDLPPIYAPRGLNTLYAVYLDPEALADSPLGKGERLPDIGEAVRFSKYGQKQAFILRDRSVYGRGTLQELVDDGCAVVVTSWGNHVGLEISRKLPEKCKAPSGPSRSRQSD